MVRAKLHPSFCVKVTPSSRTIQTVGRRKERINNIKVLETIRDRHVAVTWRKVDIVRKPVITKVRIIAMPLSTAGVGELLSPIP